MRLCNQLPHAFSYPVILVLCQQCDITLKVKVGARSRLLFSRTPVGRAFSGIDMHRDRFIMSVSVVERQTLPQNGGKYGAQVSRCQWRFVQPYSESNPSAARATGFHMRISTSKSEEKRLDRAVQTYADQTKSRADPAYVPRNHARLALQMPRNWHGAPQSLDCYAIGRQHHKDGVLLGKCR